jgi:hypothetical protein
MLAVRRFAAGDAPGAAAIIRGLPDYFTGDVPAKVERDAASRASSNPMTTTPANANSQEPDEVPGGNRRSVRPVLSSTRLPAAQSGTRRP